MPSELIELSRRWLDSQKWNRLAYFRPYPFQQRFFGLSKENVASLLMAGNGVGKTFPGAVAAATHLTGRYPADWPGRRFDHPIKLWAATLDDGFQKDNNQAALLGEDLGESLGTGWVPRDCIVGKPKPRQSGIGDVADSVNIRHVSGGNSKLIFKTYKQGWRKFQGAKPDVIWMDEQPEEQSADEGPIWSEVLTRLVRSADSIVYLTLTPLLGETALIRDFLSPKTPGFAWVGATWDDAPHMTPERKAMLRASYPAHELETRTLGVPMMGGGKVFKVSETDIKCEPFPIPAWFRIICGIDFGIDHPFATAWLAYDADKDIEYVIDGFRMSDKTALHHAEAIKTRNMDWCPVAWPHDGLNRKDDGSAKALPLWHMYRKHGLNMLPVSARYEDDVGGGQPVEPIVLDLTERMSTGKFKVFSTLPEFFEEFRSLHRKDGRIVATRDDLIKAVMYAKMMRRYALPQQRPGGFAPKHQERLVSMWTR